jgi:exopolyphosphatase / guanosine-5'-triphosphate,3'-diphosphate pyrophosphatase
MAIPGYRAAVIDLGSTTAHLAVFDIREGAPPECVAERAEALRLLERRGADGRLDDATIRDVVDALQELLREAAGQDVDRVEVVATAVLRDSDGERVVRRVREAIGLPVEVVSGEEEGRRASLAALHSVPLEDGVAVDLGGGSLQLCEIRDRRVGRVASLPLGALRLLLRHPGAEAPDHATVTALRREISGALRTVPWLDGGTLVGMGGTLRTLGRIDRRARAWAVPHGHGYTLTLDAVESIWDLVSRVPLDARRAIAGLPDHRVDLIVPGALVALWLLRTGGHDTLRLCDPGLREGTVLRDREPPAVDELRAAGLRDRFGADADADLARDVALDLAARLGHRGDPTIGAAAWLLSRWTRVPPQPGPLAALLAEPVFGWWQDELLAVADLVSPVPRARLDAVTRERGRVLAELAASGAYAMRVDGDALRLRVRGPKPSGLAERFARAFGRPLRLDYDVGSAPVSATV